MFKRVKKNRGQTALEYALVIGVIVVGVIFAGQKIFGKKDSVAEGLMKDAITQARGTLTNPGDGG
jgi:uncharacterized protein (UPF0333 family)